MTSRILLAALLLAACDDDAEPFTGDPDYVRDPALDVELVSARGDARSHNVGQNCMQCHDLDNSPDFDFQTYWPQVAHEGKD